MVLYNCGDPANANLTLDVANQKPGSFLHPRAGSRTTATPRSTCPSSSPSGTCATATYKDLVAKAVHYRRHDRGPWAAYRDVDYAARVDDDPSRHTRSATPAWYDADGSRRVEMREFLLLVQDVRDYQEVRRARTSCSGNDRDRSGFIERRELVDALRALGVDPTAGRRRARSRTNTRDYASRRSSSSFVALQSSSLSLCMSRPFFACASLAHLPPRGSCPIPASTKRPLEATASALTKPLAGRHQRGELAPRLVAHPPQPNRAVAAPARAKIRPA